jgi:hypothetical protein
LARLSSAIEAILTLRSKITTMCHKGLRWLLIVFCFETSARLFPVGAFHFRRMITKKV